LAVFSAFLKGDDAQRASDVIEKLLANGFCGLLHHIHPYAPEGDSMSENTAAGGMQRTSDSDRLRRRLLPSLLP
jgi:hypothetical protein